MWSDWGSGLLGLGLGLGLETPGLNIPAGVYDTTYFLWNSKKSRRMLPLVDYCRRLNCHLQATFCIAAAGGIHSSITQQSGPIHVVITSRRSYDDARSVAGRNAVLAGNGSDVLARSLVSAHCTAQSGWRLGAPHSSVHLSLSLRLSLARSLTV